MQHYWAGLMAFINKCQQCEKWHSQGARPLFRVFAHMGRVFGLEKNIFGFRIFNYTYWAFVRAPGRVWWGGLQWMGLDDTVPIGKVLPFLDVPITWGSCLLLVSAFHAKKKLLVAKIYSHLFQCFLDILGGRNKWMEWDRFG